MHENPLAKDIEASAEPGAGCVVLRYVAGGAQPSRAGRDHPVRSVRAAARGAQTSCGGCRCYQVSFHGSGLIYAGITGFQLELACLCLFLSTGLVLVKAMGNQIKPT